MICLTISMKEKKVFAVIIGSALLIISGIGLIRAIRAWGAQHTSLDQLFLPPLPPQLL